MRDLRRAALACAMAAMISGCYLSDDEGGRTRREMDEEFETSTGGDMGGVPGACTDASNPDCDTSVEPVRCGAGYPDCPDGRPCVDDPSRGCHVGEDPTCPGVCE